MLMVWNWNDLDACGLELESPGCLWSGTGMIWMLMIWNWSDLDVCGLELE